MTLHKATGEAQVIHALRDAMERGRPVSITFAERVKDDDDGKPVKDAQGNYVLEDTTRTLELYDMGRTISGHTWFQALDRVSTNRGAAVQTRILAHLVKDWSVHRSHYTARNDYLVKRVRRELPPGLSDRLDDDGLWSALVSHWSDLRAGDTPKESTLDAFVSRAAGRITRIFS